MASFASFTFTTSTSKKKCKKRKLPCFVVNYNPEVDTTLRQELRDFAAPLRALGNSVFSVKYTHESITVFIRDADAWERFKEKLDRESREYHTYARKTEKAQAFVLRGLEGEPDMQDITSELANFYFLEVQKIYKMKTRYKPLYLIVFDSSVTLTELQTTVKTLDNKNVTWEYRRNESQVMQCHRCQMWGHSSQYCTRAVKCSKCAGPHEITACTSSTVKCANCNQEHRSRTVDCSVYRFRYKVLRRGAQLPTNTDESPSIAIDLN